MTVAELIEKLKEMPQDAEVNIGIDTDWGFDCAQLKSVSADADKGEVWLTEK